MLSEDQLRSYHENGIVVPDYQFPADLLEGIKADHARLIARHPEFTDMCPTVLAYDLCFLNYVRAPGLIDMVGQILGPDFALWNSSFFAKPPFKGRRTPWHQDGDYWPIRPINTCTVWIAVDDSTPENGCLRVIPGSHKARRVMTHRMNKGKDVNLSQELDPLEYDESQAQDIVLRAGQISLHDVFLVHGSEPNLSSKPRRGMTLRFMPTTSVFDRDLARQQQIDKELGVGHQKRTLFLMRGQDRSGRNDFSFKV